MLYSSKKIVSSLLAVSLLALSGCGKDSSSVGTTPMNSNGASGEVINLNLWHYYNAGTKDAFDLMITEFNDTVGRENNIFVEAYSHSSVNALATTLVDAANQTVGIEDLPDIFAAYSDTALLLNEMGKVAAMDPYFTQGELDLYQQDFLNEGRFDAEGNLKILPVAKSTEMLYINQTDFEIFSDATGVQLSELETWEGIARVAEAYYNWTDSLTEQENDGSALFGVDSLANFMLVAARQLGDEMYDYSEDSINFGLSEQSAEKIWDSLIVPYISGYFGQFGSYRSDDVKSGDLLMYAGSNSSVDYFPSEVQLGRAEAYEIVGVSMGYPYFENSEKISVQQGAGFVVSKSDEVRERAAAVFLKWFTSPEKNLVFAVLTGYIPVQNAALSYDDVLEVTQNNTQGEISSIIQSSIAVTYLDVLPTYEFYANKPFDGSYDTRLAIAASAEKVIEESTQVLTTMLAEGSTRDEAIEILTGDEAFAVWYKTLESSVQEILD